MHTTRTLGILELLSRSPRGLPLQAVADALGIPKSAAHRLLGELSALGWVRKDDQAGLHHLTLRLASLAFHHLAEAGVAEVAQPILDRLAQESGEMVRLGVIDGREQFWVAKAQGARSGLRYDPDMGNRAKLTCTASGIAWLAALEDEDVKALVEGTGFERDPEVGPNAPRTLAAVLKRVRQARQVGYACTVETAHPGTSALAAAVRLPSSGRVVATLSVAGPSFRFTEARMKDLAPSLLKAAEELSGPSLSFGWLIHGGGAPAPRVAAAGAEGPPQPAGGHPAVSRTAPESPVDK